MAGSIYYAMIVLPIMYFIVTDFILQSQLTAIGGQQYLINCPFPINQGTLNSANIVNNMVTYNVSYSGTINNGTNGIYFNCYLQPNGLEALQTISKPYGSTFIGIAYGYVAFLGDSFTFGVGKIQPALTIVYLYLNAPAVISGLAWFSFVTGFLLLLIGLGVVLVIRGVS